MQLRKLGRTGLDVTDICLGTMTWGNQNTEAEGHDQMDYALEQGINFFDTAEMYAVPPSAESYGKTESIIGTWFRARGTRDKVILASKMAGPGMPWVRGGSIISATTIPQAIDASLKRLQTDYMTSTSCTGLTGLSRISQTTAQGGLISRMSIVRRTTPCCLRFCRAWQTPSKPAKFVTSAFPTIRRLAS